MSGDLKVLSETNGFSSYEVSSGLVTFSYFPNGTVIGASDTDWHLIEDSASEVNGEKIDQKIRNGVVILQTSIDGTNWITELVKGNIAGSETDYSENFYETAEIQLVNGCYYRVIVAYEVERNSMISNVSGRKGMCSQFCISDESRRWCDQGKLCPGGMPVPLLHPVFLSEYEGNVGRLLFSTQICAGSDPQ